MIRHVVMWRVQGETAAEREMKSTMIKAAFQKLLGQIPGMRHLEAGVGTTAGEDMCDVVLIADFDSAAALEAYAVHPQHLSVRDQLAGIRVGRHCVDFEIDDVG